MDSIIKSQCDVCGYSGPVASRHDFNGMPTATTCKVCDPESFEHLARADIDRWLDGDESAIR